MLTDHLTTGVKVIRDECGVGGYLWSGRRWRKVVSGGERDARFPSRVVAWEGAPDGEWAHRPAVVYESPDISPGGLWHTFALSHSEHVAFLYGTMPPEVYADWLEERVPDFPAEGLALLRGW